MDVVEAVHKSLGPALLIATTAATILVSAAYTYHLHLSIAREGEAPVQWSWIPLLGNAIELGSRPLEFLAESSAKRKDIFGMVVAGNRMFIISDPHSSHVILKPTKSFSWEEFHHLILTNFFGSDFHSPGRHDYDEDLMRKWYSNYLLSDGALSKVTKRMQARLAQDIRSQQSCASVPLYGFLSKLIFQASVAALFNDAAANDTELFAAFQAFDQHLPMAAGGFKVDYAAGPKRARSLLLKAMRKYKGTDNSEFIQKRFEYFDGFGWATNTDCFQLAILWASVGNTMPSVFWLMFYLMQNEMVLAKVRQEMDRVCTGGQGAEVSQEQLNDLQYLDCCITETLRLCTGSLIMRHVQQPCEISLASGKKYKFRKGDRVGLCPPLWHMDSEIYPQPQLFNPDRWLLDQSTGATADEVAFATVGKIAQFKDNKPLPTGIAFMPFGGGATLCPGRRFARNEIKTLVVFLLQRFEIGFAGQVQEPGFDGARAGIGIFPPKKDVDVFISRRL